MKNQATVSLSAAVFSLALFLPGAAPTAAAKSLPVSSAADTAAAQTTAARMVAAEATLEKPLDGRKVQTGAQFQAILNAKVKLNNGTQLPSGAKLIGTVAQDQMNPSGNSQLVLRFTQVRLKDGKVIPIKATILALNQPDSPDILEPAEWNHNSYNIDQIAAMPGVDLHSSIVGNNSGVFVTAKRDDIKLSSGSGFLVAIEARPGSAQNSSGGA